jgi:hypothetical protein
MNKQVYWHTYWGVDIINFSGNLNLCFSLLLIWSYCSIYSVIAVLLTGSVGHNETVGNRTSQLWKSVSRPVIVGFVWNFSHNETMMIIATTPPTDVKQNHMNLKHQHCGLLMQKNVILWTNQFHQISKVYGIYAFMHKCTSILLKGLMWCITQILLKIAITVITSRTSEIKHEKSCDTNFCCNCCC